MAKVIKNKRKFKRIFHFWKYKDVPCRICGNVHESKMPYLHKKFKKMYPHVN